MPSITTWSRLEPRTTPDIEAGYAARVHDGVWFLARQWQLGEFQGEDAGTPIVARWRARVAAVTRYHPGPVKLDTRVASRPYDPDLPLEVQVERQPLRRPRAGPVEGLRLAVESGQHFLRLLRLQHTQGDYSAAFVTAYAVHSLTGVARAGLDLETMAFADLVAGRALDGRRLRAALGDGPRPQVDPALGIAGGDIAEVEAACTAWIRWSDQLFSQPGDAPPTWQADRFEYAFSLAARVGEDAFGERTLTADRYDDGTLDWYSFDFNGHVDMGTFADTPGEVVTRTVIPAPVTFHGAPAPRFWEFEDARIDLGALQPGSTDLPQVLLVDTLTGYGNDWYVIPIELPTGTMTESRSLVVTDTFGVRTLIRPLGDPALSDRARGWRMFSLSFLTKPGEPAGPALSNLFFLPSNLAQPLEGPVLEEVMLLRDELANLAWAIERRLESPMEVGVETAKDVVAFAASTEGPREVPRYRLATPTPAHWVPLIPAQVSPGSAEVRLVRGAVLGLDGGAHPVPAVARLLLGDDANRRLSIPEEEVPREGVVVRRSWQAARWHDGRVFVWAGNRASVGRGEGSSGLAFDRLDG